MPPTVAVTWVHGDYFGTFGVPLLKGRGFSPDEQRENRRVAIVSRRIAEHSWPGEDPIGKRLKWGAADSPAPWHTVIGVAGDVVEGTPGSEPVIHVYVPYTELPDAALASPIVGLRRFVIALNGAGDPGALAGPARATIAGTRSGARPSHRSRRSRSSSATAPRRSGSAPWSSPDSAAWHCCSRRLGFTASSPSSSRSGAARSAFASRSGPRPAVSFA